MCCDGVVVGCVVVGAVISAGVGVVNERGEGCVHRCCNDQSRNRLYSIKGKSTSQQTRHWESLLTLT